MTFDNQEEAGRYYAKQRSEFEYQKMLEREKRQLEINKYLPKKKKK